jgi:NTE family protein
MLLWCQLIFAQKVALVLSGGGAKGLAHVGVLKVLEENEIPIDYIVGTSMGGVIGGFYAAGYSAEVIEQLVLSPDFQDWVEGEFGGDYHFFYSKLEDHAGILNLKLAVDSSVNIKANIASDVALNFALAEYLAPASQKANYNFDSLFIPYRAVAADIFTQNVMVLKSGRLNEALRATLSVPFFFRPLKIDDKFLFDGGIYNNFPVNIAREEFNPDVIIGVNVSSKIFEDYPYEKDQELINESLLAMLLDKSDVKMLTEKDIYIEPDVKAYSALDFQDVEALLDSGYVKTLEHLDEIKSKITSRRSCESLTVHRNEFILQSAPLTFTQLQLDAFSEPKRKYIRQFFDDDAPLNIHEIKTGYFKMISEEYFKDTYPGIVYNELDSSYNFEILGDTKNSFDVDLGGNISTRSISQIYLGLNFTHFNHYLFKHRLGVYTGRFYQSMLAASRINFPSKSKLFYLEPEFIYNHWDFINANELILSDNDPTIIDMIDRKVRLNIGTSAGTNGRLRLHSSYFYNSNEYSNVSEFMSTDTLDQQTFKGWRHGVEYSQYSLNRKQYASSGRKFLIALDLFNAQERLVPGNTSNLTQTMSDNNNWVRLKLRSEQYFGSGFFKYGYLIEGVFSNQNTGFNLTGSLINAPAFEPLVDSPTLFLENFRAYNYLAGGIRNVFSLNRKFDLRLEGYFFKPFKELTVDESIDRVFLEDVTQFYFAGTAAGVYHSILGPISMQVNYYDDPENQWGFLLHIGYLIFNNKPLD